MKQDIIDRLTRYVTIDTQSNPESTTTPSTEKQWDLLNLLNDELTDLGLETDIDEQGYLFATLDSNVDIDLPTVGFLAHIDTSPDFNASHVNPQIIDNYDGTPIQLGKTNRTLSQDVFPAMKNVEGHTLMITDGTSLLGADDKAGVVEIMEALKHLTSHPEIKHGRIRVAFTPDEEIGKGPHAFDVERFNADFAYTMDGSQFGELQYESFNAAGAKVHIQGKNVHPGTAKNQMVNALTLAMKLNEQLPELEVPEHTENREGFFHLTSMSGTVEEAELSYIIRDHDRKKFEKRKQLLINAIDQLNESFDQKRLTIEMKDQYYNMREVIEEDMRAVEVAQKAMESLKIDPIIEPIRGGTDGSKISFMGLPTPNLFAGGENFHGRYEFVAVESMQAAAEVIQKIIELVVQ